MVARSGRDQWIPMPVVALGERFRGVAFEDGIFDPGQCFSAS